MTMRWRYLLIAVVGLGMIHHAQGEEPDKLRVKTGREMASRLELPVNQQVANTIVEHLRQSGQLHSYKIDINFEAGTAELSGSVADQLQREEALRLVQGVPGVERVRDRLTLAADAGVTQTQATGPRAAEPVPPASRPASPPLKNGQMAEPLPIFQAPPPSPTDLNPPKMPPYAWPTYAPYNNYSRVAYPQLYPYKAWPYIGPVYPFPKIPLGWRKITLEWQDGHWWYGTHSNSHDWWLLRFW